MSGRRTRDAADMGIMVGIKAKIIAAEVIAMTTVWRIGTEMILVTVMDRPIVMAIERVPPAVTISTLTDMTAVAIVTAVCDAITSGAITGPEGTDHITGAGATTFLDTIAINDT